MDSSYQNRELSWLKFNERVLEESRDPSIPLMERLRFAGIYTSNLDEFYMIRVGSLCERSTVGGEDVDNKSGLTVKEQLDGIFAETRRLELCRTESYKSIAAALLQVGIEQVDINHLSDEDDRYLRSYFENELRPVISPQIIDKHHPFPFLHNLECYICVQLSTKGSFVKLGMIPPVPQISRIIRLGGPGIRFALAEDVIYHYCDLVFGRYKPIKKMMFRVTRNADLAVDEALFDYDIDYRDAMEQLLKNRKKMMPVRLEVRFGQKGEMLKHLREKLSIAPNQLFFADVPFDIGFLPQLEELVGHSRNRSLFYPKLTPQPSPMVKENESMITQIQKQDILLSFPYESTRPLIQLLQEAGEDRDVISIKICLYRVAKESQVVEALIKAAEKGKDVHAVIELRARFDEASNIHYSRRMEEAGITITYGMDDYKVHCKLLLITRKTGGGIQYITQLSTGNYNEITARLYTDLSLMTVNVDIGLDAVSLFDSLALGEFTERTSQLLVAPLAFKDRILALIDGEMVQTQKGGQGAILLKLNSLTDIDILDKLVEASQCGVKIRMIVRGICCLTPGIPGVTENVSIISIVGRFLEHSRVFVFGTGERRKMYLSSADLMTRNTQRRVEAAVPVLDIKLQDRIMDMLELLLQDNVKARVMQQDGGYIRQTPSAADGRSIDSQIMLYKAAYATAEASLTQAPAKAETAKSPKKSFMDRITNIFKHFGE